MARDPRLRRDLFLEGARLGPRSPVLVEHDEATRLGYLCSVTRAWSGTVQAGAHAGDNLLPPGTTEAHSHASFSFTPTLTPQ